ncbi:MAG: PDZ domain-containing protein [Clostridiales bacterium]|nr:PDZ domain-containing protein [Clostridiales bacterium]
MEHKDPVQDFDFMKEKIKERPVNKKKLLRRTIITASMAVIFGLVACLTFLVLEPLFSNWLYPQEEPQQVTFPAEEDEMLPEDMLAGETQTEEENMPAEMFPVPAEVELEVEDYQTIYDKLYVLAQENSKAIVTVTGVTSDRDWFNNPYENRGRTSGVIVADTGKEYLILVDKKPIETVETIQVTFRDGAQAQAVLKKIDPVTGLAIIGVEQELLDHEAKGQLMVATLGSSNNPNVLGSPVLILGSPYGAGNSIAYGMVTSMGNVLHLPDAVYKLLKTDVYGSPDASGVVLNMRGQVIGMVNGSFNEEGMENQVNAIGISELKNTIERLSNGQEQAYLGIYGTDVTTEAQKELKVPQGAYVTEIALDSPAMQAGIQSGDIIIKLGGEDVGSYADYISQLGRVTAGNTVTVTVMRQGQKEYRELDIEVTTRTAE